MRLSVLLLALPQNEQNESETSAEGQICRCSGQVQASDWIKFEASAHILRLQSW